MVTKKYWCGDGERRQAVGGWTMMVFASCDMMTADVCSWHSICVRREQSANCYVLRAGRAGRRGGDVVAGRWRCCQQCWTAPVFAGADFVLNLLLELCRSISSILFVVLSAVSPLFFWLELYSFCEPAGCGRVRGAVFGVSVAGAWTDGFFARGHPFSACRRKRNFASLPG